MRSQTGTKATHTVTYGTRSYALMQAGMNANKTIDTLTGHYPMFFLSCLFWSAALFALTGFLLKNQDVRA